MRVPFSATASHFQGQMLTTLVKKSVRKWSNFMMPDIPVLVCVSAFLFGITHIRLKITP